MGEKVGRSTVSRVTRTLEQRVKLRRAPIAEPVPYLYLDLYLDLEATFLDARWVRRFEERCRPRRVRRGHGREAETAR